MADTGAVQVELNAVVTKRVPLSDDLWLLHVRPEGWSLPSFKPGQYCTIGLPDESGKLIRRVYSIASPPSAEELELYIVVVKEGQLTPRLYKLKEGDRLFLGKKIVGLFTLDDVPRDQNIVFAGTGTGIAPYMSMLRSGLAKETSRKTSLIHGVRFSPDLSYTVELETMARDNPRFVYVPLVSRPHLNPTPWSGPTGHVQDVWNGGVIEKAWGFKPQPAHTRVFLCGNPAMIKDMTSLLEKEGFKEHSRKSPGQIHVEKYW